MSVFRLRRHLLVGWLLAASWMCCGVTNFAVAAVYYVSPDGSDGNPGTAAQPFATLEKARSMVRTVNSDMMEDLIVYLRGGTYQLAQPLLFDRYDSGTNGFSVIYTAYAGERPLLSGGQHITGWTAAGNGIYRASVGPWRFRQLYVNGSRAIRARTPDAGSYHQLRSWDSGGQRIEIASNEIANWQRLHDVEMIILGKGVNQANLRVASFAVAGSSAFVTPREPERTRIFQQGYPPKEPRPYYFENAMEFLDQPGEWYLNAGTNTVFYRPRAGEDMTTATVVAPRLERLLGVQGTLAAPVHHIEFHGLTFAYATWLLPNSEGFIGDQAFTYFVQPLPNDEITSYPSPRHPAAVHVQAAHDIRFERNVFQHLGASGLNLYMGTQDVAVIGNLFRDIAATGIAVDLTLEGNPTDTRRITRRPVIRNNYITGIARDYYQNTAIAVGYTDGAVIEHNEVTDAPYTGITVGWGWDDRDNAARDTLVRYNKVWHVLTLMSDGGGIYTLSRQPGTLIAENYVHDITRAPVHGGFNISGIYLDEGSNFITVRDNVLVNTGDRPMFQNANGPSNTLINNDGTALLTIANAGLEPSYWDIRPPAPPQPPPPSGNLIVAYAFDESSGTTAADSSGNEKTATLVNGPIWTGGKYGNAIRLDGIDDYVTVVNPNLPTGDYTYEAWVNLDRNNAFQTIMEALDGVGGAELEFDIAEGGTVQIWSNNTQRLMSVVSLPVGTWSHVALTRQGSLIRVYINGALQSQTGLDAGILNFSTCPLFIGVDADSACTGLLNGYLDGRIDEVRIYNRARSQTEIQTDMHTPIAGLSSDTTPLVAPSLMIVR
jgi:hypothetical protein